MSEHTSADIAVDIDASGVAIVTLNRPRKRNALSLAMWEGLGSTFRDMAARPDVRVVILTGAGGNFCAGADISEFATVRNSIEAGHRYEAIADGATFAIRDCPKPTIAAVSGYGAGGGCGIALACDIRVGDKSTRMGIPAARLGNVYGTLECELLRRQVGLANAKLVLYSGRFFDLDECQRMGLVDAAGPSQAVDTAREIAHQMADNAPLSLKGAKIVLEALDRRETDERRDEIQSVINAALESEDYREAARAFVEKRKPVFKGR
jgi:enoyl-CoA hydratase/carnithine racemase